MQLEEILKFFASFIEAEVGIVYADHNYFQLQNRLEEIAKATGATNIEQLWQNAQQGLPATVKQLLIDVATNNETSFFRDKNVFKAIESVILPNYFGNSSASGSFSNQLASVPLSIWSAASSTGQEALSLAILLKEWSQKNSKPVNFSITATDISERVLAKAKSSRYSQLEVQRGLPAPLLVKYFSKDSDDRWTAVQEITKDISFRKLNLKEPFSFAQKFDLVLCRNVLIYQNVPAKIEILKKITASLAPGGFLILGSGESLLGLSDEYQQTAADGAVIYKRKVELVKAA